MNILPERLHQVLSDKETVKQFIRYGLVGVLNTLVTLVVIFVCKSVMGINDYVSNAAGYVAGVINSFIWNRQFVFHSSGKLRREMVLFLIGFGICYCVQFAIVWTLNQSWFGDMEFDFGYFSLSGYGIATLIGMVAYTVCNFIYNRCVAFKN